MEFIGVLWDEVVIRPMTNSLVLLYDLLFNNFGLAIVAFTFVIRSATFPLTLRQTRMTRRMSSLQPKLKEIQKKYAGDRNKISQETMKMYRESGMSPLGCLGPFALQFPIFIGMFFAIRDTLPTTPEALAELGTKLYGFLSFLDKAIPVNDSFLWLKLGEPDPSPLVLPVLVGVSTFVMTRMTTSSGANQQASTARMMQWMMPLMLTFITFQFASGLAIYWIVSNLVGIGIQYFATGWGGLFPARKGADSGIMPGPVEEMIDNDNERQSRDDRQERGGGRRTGAKGARGKPRRSRSRRY